MKNIYIPADVPVALHDEFISNYQAITKGTDRIFIFAADQKIEHLNSSFYGPDISPEDSNPQHLFNIASQSPIGACAMHVGLITRYAQQYSSINYIAKLNGKTKLLSAELQDPFSNQLWTVEQVVTLKKETKLPIRGVGYTIYLGSVGEATMLEQAAQISYKAHQNGLLSMAWMYPRGKSIAQERDGQLIATAAGVATALGFDIAKVNMPESNNKQSALELLALATQAAGNTKLVCSGGNQQDLSLLLPTIYDQLHQANSAGVALGRNIHQRSLTQAVACARAVAAIIYDNVTLQKALSLS